MKPKISLIIPVYGTEKYLKRCINSVISQNYKEIEIIVVNDCSPGNAEELVNELRAVDGRIRYVKHDVNRGLYQARLTGASEATGDYIAFLDSDDYVAFDFYYSLITKIEEEDADIVIGKTVIEKEDGTRFVNHFHDCSLNFDTLEGEDVRCQFWKQRGRCYSWHTVWNKLYSKTLWDKAFPFYQKIASHLIMTEDIAFSSVLFYFAQKVTTVKTSAYFYCENEGASTDSRNMTLKKFKKNMSDIIMVFDFVRDFLESQNAEARIMEDYDSFREYYAKLWLALIHGDFVGKYRKEALQQIDILYPGLQSTMKPEDYFYDTLRVKWHDGIEVAKSLINDPEMEYVSFDIFDTLITRPLYKPHHVFELMDQEFKKLLHTNMSFAKIRMDGETAARVKYGMLQPDFQDITLDEIYEVIGEVYHLDKYVIDRLKEKEIELEIQLSKCRETIRDLFFLAKALGKKVIIVSDMYLPKDVIIRILEKHGYTGYEHLYLSSDVRLTKYTGDLFKYVINDLEVSGNKILHLGDTWANDFENPSKLGIRTFLIPKTIEVFENIIKDQTTNRCAVIGNWAAAGIIKQNSYRESIGYGAMMAVVANKYFDNPFRSFHESSDFNVDPYFIGYYVVGMHLYGFAKWLLDQSKMLGYKKLYFMSRDGYLPMLVYKKIAATAENAPKAVYLYSSRKAVMPYIIKEKFDLYDFPTAIMNQSAKTMRNLLEFCMRAIDDDTYETILRESEIDINARFTDKAAYNKFIGIFIEKFYCEATHKKSKKLCEEYYSCIDPESAAVDMGYSGRIQGAISEAVGRGVDVFFVHQDSNQYLKESLAHNFKIHSFYDYEPCMSGVIREHVLSSFEPSCTGFAERDQKAEPVFEIQKKDIQDRWVVKEIHRGALDFIDDFINAFGDYRNVMSIKPAEISLPYEGFLRFVNDVDLKIFSASFFEDEVWGGANRINIAQFVREQHNQFNCNNMFPNSTNMLFKLEEEDQIALRAKKMLTKYPLMRKVAKQLYNRLK